MCDSVSNGASQTDGKLAASPLSETPANGGTKECQGLQLRDYQRAAIEACHDHLDAGGPPAALTMATASGKTTTAAVLIRERIESGRASRVLCLGHTAEIVQQWEETLLRVWPEVDIGVVAAKLDRREYGHRITAASVQTVHRRADLLGDDIDLVIADECHLVPPRRDSMFRRIFDALPGAGILGLTGSPWRLDSGSIVGDTEDHLFRASLADVSARFLVDRGFLVPLATKGARGEIDAGEVAIRAGDFAAGELELVAAADDAVTRVVTEGLELSSGRRTLLWFAVGVDHATKLRDEIRQRGETAEVVTGETPQDERERILAEFAAGDIRSVVNVAVLQAGYDCPPIDAVLMARPTCSPALWVQCVGRGLRLAPGKTDCLCVDFGGNWSRLGNPLSPRPPAKGRERREGDRTGPVEWLCESCRHVNEPSAERCGSCDAERPKREAPDLGRGRVVNWEDVPVLDVKAVSVRLHEKDGKQPSLRVSYKTPDGWFSEWLAFQSEKPFARHKAREWWRTRFPGMHPPASARRAITYPRLRERLQRMTRGVRVDTSGKWPRIVGYRLNRSNKTPRQAACP